MDCEDLHCLFKTKQRKDSQSKQNSHINIRLPLRRAPVFLSLLPTSILPHVQPNALLPLAEEFFVGDVKGTFVDP